MKVDSGKEVVDYPPGHVGQAKISSRIGVSELFMVQAQGVEYGGMQVMHVDSVFHGHPTNLIRSSVGNA